MFTIENKKDDDKISLKKAKEILNEDGNNYTDQEVEIVRNFLYQLAKADYDKFKANEK